VRLRLGARDRAPQKLRPVLGRNDDRYRSGHSAPRAAGDRPPVPIWSPEATPSAAFSPPKPDTFR
jgi:hypothetical protein